MQLSRIRTNILSRFVFALFFLLIVSNGCKEQNSRATTSDVNDAKADYSYDLTTPTRIYDLPKALKEISGISFINDYTLAAIQDEKGTIYHYDLLKAEIVEKVKFKDSGDFEDLAVVGNAIYAINSQGKLYKVFTGKDDKIHKDQFDSKLLEKSDVEGLAHDLSQNQLLIACKGKTPKMKEDERCVFTFNLQNKQYSEKPLIVLKNREIAIFVKKNRINLPKKLLNDLSEDAAVFLPSAIAVHPITKDIYLLSSVNKLFVVIHGSTLKIKHLEALDQSIFIQPEGMSFDSEGNLFISNEAGSEEFGTILKFAHNILDK